MKTGFAKYSYPGFCDQGTNHFTIFKLRIRLSIVFKANDVRRGDAHKEEDKKENTGETTNIIADTILMCLIAYF